MYWFWNKGSHRLWEGDCSDQRSAGDDSDYRQWGCTETEVECISSHWFPWRLQGWWLYSTCADTRMSFSSYVYSNHSEPFLFIENTLAMGLNGRPSGMPLRSFGFVGDVASWKLHKVLMSLWERHGGCVNSWVKIELYVTMHKISGRCMFSTAAAWVYWQ